MGVDFEVNYINLCFQQILFASLLSSAKGISLKKKWKVED
jgi:hypothetical protein